MYTNHTVRYNSLVFQKLSPQIPSFPRIESWQIEPQKNRSPKIQFWIESPNSSLQKSSSENSKPLVWKTRFFGTRFFRESISGGANFEDSIFWRCWSPLTEGIRLAMFDPIISNSCPVRCPPPATPPTVTKFSNPTVNRIYVTDYLNFCVCASMYPCVPVLLDFLSCRAVHNFYPLNMLMVL